MLMKWDLTQSGSRDQISTKQMTWPWIIEQGKNTKDMSMNITSVEDKNIRNLALLITILVAAIHNIILASFDWQFSFFEVIMLYIINAYAVQNWFLQVILNTLFLLEVYSIISLFDLGIDKNQEIMQSVYNSWIWESFSLLYLVWC